MTIIMTKHMMTYEERNSDEIALPASSITANNNITITPSMYGRIFLRVREMFQSSYAWISDNHLNRLTKWHHREERCLHL